MKRYDSEPVNPRGEWLHRHPTVDRILGVSLGYDPKQFAAPSIARFPFADFRVESKLRRIQAIKDAGKKSAKKGGTRCLKS